MSFLHDFFKGVLENLAANAIYAIAATVFAAIASAIAVKTSDQTKTDIKDYLDKIGTFIWDKKVNFLLFLLGILLGIAIHSAISIAESRPETPSKKIVEDQEFSRLKAITDREYLICGVNEKQRGFGFKDGEELSSTTIKGLDADFCRAVSSAIFRNPNQWEAKYLVEEEDAENNRFRMVANGEVDVAFRNTSITPERDFRRGVDFGEPNFYDRLSILFVEESRSDRRRETLKERKQKLDGKKICVAQPTSTRENLEKFKAQLRDEDNINIEIKISGSSIFDNSDEAFNWFLADLDANPETIVCDAFASDNSQVRGFILKYEQKLGDISYIYGDDSDEFIAAETLAPMLPEGDLKWKSIIDYVVYTTFRAEELGVTKQGINQEDFNNLSEGTLIGKFLDPDPSQSIWKGLGIEGYSPTREIISSVGNYGEIYSDNLDKVFGFEDDEVIPVPERIPNALVKDGGALSSPPF